MKYIVLLIGFILLALVGYVMTVISSHRKDHVRIIQTAFLKTWRVEYRHLYFPFWIPIYDMTYFSKEEALKSARLLKNPPVEEV